MDQVWIGDFADCFAETHQEGDKACHADDCFFCAGKRREGNHCFTEGEESITAARVGTDGKAVDFDAILNGF